MCGMNMLGAHGFMVCVDGRTLAKSFASWPEELMSAGYMCGVASRPMKVPLHSHAACRRRANRIHALGGTNGQQYLGLWRGQWEQRRGWV
jgi:hypothetical protein